MNFEMRILRIAALFCVCLLPKMSFGSACTTQTLATLLGTTCSIGDVNYAFLDNPATFGNGTGSTILLALSDVTVTPDGSDPLNPQLSVTLTAGGPFSVSTLGVGTTSSIGFAFSWDATILTSGLQFGSVTNTLVNPVVQGAFGDANILGSDGFAAILGFGSGVESGAVPTNPVTTPIDPALLPIDQAIWSAFVTDSSGFGASASFDALDIQYHLTPTPEPSSLLLLGTGLLSLGSFFRRKRLGITRP